MLCVVKLRGADRSAPAFSLVEKGVTSGTHMFHWDKDKSLPYLTLNDVNQEDCLCITSPKLKSSIKVPFLRLMAISPALKNMALSVDFNSVDELSLICDLDQKEMTALQNFVVFGWIMNASHESVKNIIGLLGLSYESLSFTRVSYSHMNLPVHAKSVMQDVTPELPGINASNHNDANESLTEKVADRIEIPLVKVIQKDIIENASSPEEINIVKHGVMQVNHLNIEIDGSNIEGQDKSPDKGDNDIYDLDGSDMLFNDHESDEEYIPPSNTNCSEIDSDSDDGHEQKPDEMNTAMTSNEENQTKSTRSCKRKIAHDYKIKPKRNRKSGNDLSPYIQVKKLTQESFTLEESRLLWRALFPNGEDQSENNFYFSCDKCKFSSCDPGELAVHKHYHTRLPKESKLAFRCNQCQFETHRQKDVKCHLLRHKLLCPYDQVTENLRVHFCDGCEQSFLTAKAKDNHKLEFHFDEYHICPFVGCDEKFPHDKLMNHTVHVTTKHYSYPRQVCIQCGFRYQTGQKQSYKKHIDSQGPYHSNKCATCKQEMKSWDDHVEHVKEFHDNKWRYFCGKCDATFDTKELAKAHRSQVHFPRDFTSVKCSQCSFNILHTKIHQHWQIFHPECLKCEECDKVLKNEKLMDRHKNLHRKGSIFSCNSCDWEFSDKLKLDDHMNRSHRVYHADLAYKCGTCFYGLKTDASFQKHNISAHNGKAEKLPITVHKCDFCHKGFFTQSQFVFHLEYNHDPILKYECGQCKFQSQDRVGLENHILQTNHAPNESNELVLDCYSCRKCDKKDPDLLKLLAHIKKCHLEYRDFPLKCSKCPTRCLTQTLLHEHTEICLKADLFQCEECGSKFVTSNDLAKHRTWKHKYIQSKSNHFKCKYCTKNFVSKEILDRHVKIHLKLAKTCQFCGIIYCYKNIMRAHMYEVHRTDNHYLCRKCEFKSKSKADLEKHQSCKHGSILKPELGNHQACEFCDFSSKNAHSLDLHARKFHCGLEKNFVCEHCSMSFLTEPELRKHRNRHTWEESFICQHCGEKYSQKWSLTAHIRRTHLGYSNNFKSKKLVI